MSRLRIMYLHTIFLYEKVMLRSLLGGGVWRLHSPLPSKLPPHAGVCPLCDWRCGHHYSKLEGPYLKSSTGVLCHVKLKVQAGKVLWAGTWSSHSNMKPTLKRYRRKPSNKKHAKFLCKAVSTYSARRVGKVSTHRARRLKKEERRFHDHEIRVYIYVSSGSVAQSGCSTIARMALHHHTVRVLHHHTLWHHQYAPPIAWSSISLSGCSIIAHSGCSNIAKLRMLQHTCSQAALGSPLVLYLYIVIYLLCTDVS